jgi:hypothetical protein
MLIDFSEMFSGVDRDADLAAHVMRPVAEQDRVEAEFLQAAGRGTMVCDLVKKRAMEDAK